MPTLQQRPIRRINSSSTSLSSMSPPSSPSEGALRRVRTPPLEEEDTSGSLSPVDIYQQQEERPDDDYYNNEKEKPSNIECSIPLLSWLALPVNGRSSPGSRRALSSQFSSSMDEEKANRTEFGLSLSDSTVGSFDEEPYVPASITTTTESKSSAAAAAEKKRLADKLKEKLRPIDVDQYAAGRVMTKTQEKWNAITMVPPTIYAAYFLLSHAWIPATLLAEAQDEYRQHNELNMVRNTGLAGMLDQWLGDSETGCLSTTWFPAVPPLTVLAVIIGTSFHMPFSFLYHWTFAHKLHGKARVNHWSRRMDQAMIHFAAALYAYGSSGSANYFLACALFNLDSAYRHFLPHFRPRSNQMRITIAMIAYGLPILRRGDWERFCFLFVVCAISGWFFSKYPIGGWSHAAFHLMVGILPVVFISIAMEMPVAQQQLKLAAQCSVLLQHQD